MKKNIDEEILTKDDMENTEESNVRRVDNRPGSIFSILVFVMIFLVGYLLYPQLSMLVPIPGEKMNVETRYTQTEIAEMTYADTVIIATVKEKERNAQSRINSNGESIIAKTVVLEVKDVLKGNAEDTITVSELGGNALLNLGGKKKKYNFVYKDAAQYEKGETYLIFLSNGIVLNGRCGAIKRNSDDTYTDIRGNNYTVEEIKNILANQE